jgi:hypothetical protein
MTTWLFELDGEATNLMALMPIALACNCTVQPGPDAQLWLGGARFDGISTSEDALEEAQKTLDFMNGRNEGFDFVVRLFNKYVDEQLSLPP